MRIPDQQALKSYLLRELASLSDADPDILSDYILALLKHDRPDLEETCAQQLIDFLHEHTQPFVQKLFRHLKAMQDSEHEQAMKAEGRYSKEREDQREPRSDKRRPRSRSPRPERRDRTRRERIERTDEEGYRNARKLKQRRISSDTRLVVERIPEENCNSEAISAFFSRFGKLVEVSVIEGEHKAIIEYDSGESASKALISPEAIFGNRFVRLYHERERDQPISRPPPPILPRVTSYTAPNYQPPHHPAPVNQERVKQQRLLELSKQKQGLLSAYLEQQRALLNKLETDPSLDETTKQEIMNSIKAVDEKIHTTSTAERPLSPEIIEKQPPRTDISRKLDLRPTSILIQPVPMQLSDGNTDAARILFGSFGAVKNVLFEDDQVIVSYSNRSDAEKVFHS